MLSFGLLSSLFDLLTFVALLALVQGDENLFRSGWFVESLLTELAVMLVLRTHQPFYRSRPGRLLLASTLVIFAVTLVLPYTPLAVPFELVPLPAAVMGLVLFITLAYLAATEALKRWFYRRHGRRTPRLRGMGLENGGRDITH